MIIFYLLAIALFMIFPIAALDRNVKWGLLFKYVSETVVFFSVFGFLIIPQVLQIGTGDGGAIVFWLLLLGFVVALGEIVGYLRYRRYVKQMESDSVAQNDTLGTGENTSSGAEYGDSLVAHIFAALRISFWIWVSIYLAIIVIGGPKFDVPDEYVALLHYSVLGFSLLAGAVWRYLRARKKREICGKNG